MGSVLKSDLFDRRRLNRVVRCQIASLIFRSSDVELNDLLLRENIDPGTVLVMRHCPREPRLNAVFPWLVEENHNLFNAYQQTQGPKVEKAFQSATYLASFIGRENGFAVFAGLYKFGESTKMSYRQFWAKKELRELRDKFGMIGMEDTKGSCLWFELKRTKHFDDWRGKLIIRWPGMALSYWRWASRNHFDVYSISEESIFIERMKPWDQIVLTHAQLENLPEVAQTNSPDGEEFTSFLMRLTVGVTSVPHMEKTICISDGSTIRSPVTVATRNLRV